jgi:hypothetical protein
MISKTTALPLGYIPTAAQQAKMRLKCRQKTTSEQSLNQKLFF